MHEIGHIRERDTSAPQPLRHLSSFLIYLFGWLIAAHCIPPGTIKIAFAFPWPTLHHLHSPWSPYLIPGASLGILLCNRFPGETRREWPPARLDRPPMTDGVRHLNLDLHKRSQKGTLTITGNGSGVVSYL